METITILIPIIVSILSLLIYNDQQSKSVYFGIGGWSIDILAIIAGLYIVVFYNKELLLYIIGNVICLSHFTKMLTKIKIIVLKIYGVKQ